MTDLPNIIARVEAGEKGEKINAEIARACGVSPRRIRRPDGYEDVGPFGDYDEEWPNFTGSLDAALPGENIVAMRRLRDNGGQTISFVAIHEDEHGNEHVGHSPTEAAARRAAALRGMEKDDG